MDREIKKAIENVAQAFHWNQQSDHDLGLMLWCLFRYYAMRQKKPRPGSDAADGETEVSPEIKDRNLTKTKPQYNHPSNSKIKPLSNF